MAFKHKEAEQISNLLLERQQYAEKHHLQQAYRNVVLHLTMLYPEDANVLRVTHAGKSNATRKHNKQVRVTRFNAVPETKPTGDCDGCLTDQQKRDAENKEPKGSLKTVKRKPQQIGHQAAIDKELAHRRKRDAEAKQKPKVEAQEQAAGDVGVLMRMQDATTPKLMLQYFKQITKPDEKVTDKMREYIDAAEIEYSGANQVMALAKAIVEELHGTPA